MAQFSTNSDFSTDAAATQATGNNVSAITGWTVIQPTGGSAGSNSTYTITADAGAEGGKYCRAQETGWASAAHFMQFDAAGTIATSTALDVLFRFRIPSALSAERYVGKILISGSNYYTLRVYTSGAAQLYYNQNVTPWQSIGAADSTPDRAGTPAALVADTWYWARVHKTAAGAWSWKMWSGAIGDEPAGWSLGDGGAGGTSDTSVTTGLTGVGFLATNAVIHYDWFSVGTAGDTAPTNGSSGLTLVADGTSFALTGNTATLSRTFIPITAEAGSFTLTGADATLTYNALASITTPVLKNNTGTVIASQSGIIAEVYDLTDGSLVVRKTGLTSNGSGVVSFSDALLVASTTYGVHITYDTGSSVFADGYGRIAAA